jgi:uncharacterized protein (AIM24 family)
MVRMAHRQLVDRQVGRCHRQHRERASDASDGVVAALDRQFLSGDLGSAEVRRQTQPLRRTRVASLGAVSESGWRAAPRMRDMAEFSVGNSARRIVGEVVPAAEFTLADGDAVFFEQHTMLWKERGVSLKGVQAGGGARRLMAGMPYAVIEARGPGRIALTRDSSGEVVVIPLHSGLEVDVRGHAFLAASENVSYDFIKITGLVNILHGGEGMYMDRFVSSPEAVGLLLLHGCGNVLERRLAPGEKVLVEPAAFCIRTRPSR